MLIETLLYATARANDPARQLGLVGDAVALWSRATRRRRAWAPHEDRCRAVVREAVAGLGRRRKAVVLGSGLGRDVPLGELSRTFDDVVLVDAVHLLPARVAAWRRGSILVTADLSGWSSAPADAAPSDIDPLAFVRADPDVDLVVSANLLSQMPMAPAAWLDHRPEAARRLPADLPFRIVARHLASLADLPCRVCLLTDASYREEGLDGTWSEPVDLLHGHALPPADAAWDWEVAPFGEIARGIRRVHRVHAYHDLHAAWTRPAPTGAAPPPASR